MEKNEYQNLRQDILEDMIIQRDIVCRKTKSEMIKYLLLDDQGKYVRETLYEKLDKDTYIIGVDMGNREHMMIMSKMVEKNEVQRMGLYQLNRIYFKSNKKIEL